jgi:hypothetical protein
MYKIHVEQDPWSEGGKLYQYDFFELKPGVTSLMGCNGSGKSTLLKFIEEFADDNNIPCISYNDRAEGHSHLMEKFLLKEDFESISYMYSASEGERNMTGVSECVKKIGRAVTDCKKNGKHSLIVLLDATDSGMSIDSIAEVREVLLDVILPDALVGGVSVYAVVASNNYEWVHDPRINCVNVVTGKQLYRLTYSQWSKCIKSTRSYKNKRYKNT